MSSHISFWECGGAGVILVVRQGDEEPEITLNLHHFLGPTHLPRSICSIPGRRGMSGQRAKNARYIRRLAWATLRPGARRPRRYCVDGKRLHAKPVPPPGSLQVADRLYFCLARPAACPPGCRSCELHASLAPIVGKGDRWVPTVICLRSVMCGVRGTGPTPFRRQSNRDVADNALDRRADPPRTPR